MSLQDYVKHKDGQIRMYNDQEGLGGKKSSMIIGGGVSQQLGDAPFSRLKPDSAQQMGSEVYISAEDDASHGNDIKIRMNNENS